MAPEKKTIRILSVEDNAADIRLIAEIFKMSHFRSRVEFVRDGLEALDYLFQRNAYASAARPDLILLDLTLPRMDGHEVLRIVKDHPALKRIPVLVLSGSRSRDDINRSYELHASSYIVKPFSLDELTDVVKGIESYWSKVAEIPSIEEEALQGRLGAEAFS